MMGRRFLLLFAAACGLFWTFGVGAAEPVGLRFMTYNIRLDVASDGENAWPHRRDWVAAQIDWLRPDVFGMQEVLPGQRADLVARLPGYRLIGGGRDDGKDKGEASPIGFDTRKFELVEQGLFWLSPTPDVPSKDWDAAFNRVVTWARLRVKGTRTVVLAINTHWDHIGFVARKQSAMLMAKWIGAHARRCERIVVSGDFNSEIGGDPLQFLLEQARLREARAISKSAPFGPTVTFNAFRNPPAQAGAIDHFLVGDGVQVQRYAVISQLIEGRWPSDHFPVLIDVKIAGCQR